MNPEHIPLRDLHLPEAIGWWPAAPGWWVLAGLLAIGLGLLGWRALRKFRAGKARRRALSRLRRLKAEFDRDKDAVRLSVELSKLLRRTMLAYAPRDQVAGLTGARWLEWLDRGLPDKAFSLGPGQGIESLPYRRPGHGVPDAEVDELVRVVRRRLRTPLAEPV